MIPIIAIIALLIFINGFYVAAEFSAVSSKRPRLAQLEADGSRFAGLMKDILDAPVMLDAYVAACQLGITVTSLILGFYGQAQLTHLITPLFEQLGRGVELAETISTTVVLVVLTILTVLFGELIPKNLGVRFPERLAVWTAPPMRWSMWLFRPLIWLFNGSGQLILRLMGTSAVGEHAHVHSPEEIRMLVEESSAGGVLDQGERQLLVNMLKLRELTARKVMIPRNRMFAADINRSCDELFTLLAGSPYSRLPLYDESIDRIVGVVHLKDLLNLVHGQSKTSPTAKSQTSVKRTGEELIDDVREQRTVAEKKTSNSSLKKSQNLEISDNLKGILHPVAHVPESMPVEDVLKIMQREHIYLTIVADEYGGTSGMITIEDLFEEIIGEFDDEFDARRNIVRVQPDNNLVILGDALLEDLNELLNIRLPMDQVETLGGLVFANLGRIPEVGDTVHLYEEPDSVGDESESAIDKLDNHIVQKSSTDEGSAIIARIVRMDGNRVAEVNLTMPDHIAQWMDGES
ncbi:DUF21 domain-containing protein [Chloroflexi bacterium TSY]|nr:DUF21 domain-containing protein [Chloroflexi bacterium TSY]